MAFKSSPPGIGFLQEEEWRPGASAVSFYGITKNLANNGQGIE